LGERTGEINEVRRRINGLSWISAKTAGRRRVSDICAAIYEFLHTLGVPLRLEKQIEEFRRSGRFNLANEYSQIWNILMDVFDQTVEVLGDETMGLEGFADVLRIGLGEYQVGLIPPSLDQVLVGNVQRSRSHEVKALYILGVNDGIFPAAALEEGILSDTDRAALKTAGVELARDTRSKVFDEQYLVYRALTTPSSYLRLSWAIADSEGKSLRPSLIISRMRKLFPKIAETSDVLGSSPGSGEIEEIAGRLPTFCRMASEIGRRERNGKSNPVWTEVYRWYAGRQDWQDQCRALQAILKFKNIASAISPEKIRSLYGSPMHSSVSRLERYAACAFAFYLQYGLKAKERKILRLTPPDVGTFLHTALEKFSQEVAAGDQSWRTFDRRWCEEKVAAIVNDMLENMQGSGISASKRMTALMLRLKRVVTRAVWLIAEHIRRGAFEPVGYEIAFGEGEKLPPIVIELESGQKVSLTGRIDRVDALETDEGVYLRIVDYKSGNKDFQLADVYYGLQIQLVTYLSALTENSLPQNSLPGSGKPLMPAGILYFRLDDPLVKTTGRRSEKEIEQAILKHAADERAAARGCQIDQSDGSRDRRALPDHTAKVNKGDVLGKSSAATPEQFAVLQSHVDALLKQLCREISGGTVSIAPLKKKNYTACQYCNFGAVCQFDSRRRENAYRLAAEYKEEEIWRRMARKGGESDDGNDGQ
jgi:ATP-dependent helicase/nuclease subunit B